MAFLQNADGHRHEGNQCDDVGYALREEGYTAGTLTTVFFSKVFKEVGEYKALRELARTHTMVVQDVVRVQNRIKARSTFGAPGRLAAPSAPSPCARVA